jgi:hypothetical protein
VTLADDAGGASHRGGKGQASLGYRFVLRGRIIRLPLVIQATIL